MRRLALLVLASTAALALPAQSQASVRGARAATASTPCPGQWTVPDASSVALVRDATLCLVNRERWTRGLPVLRPAAPLGAVASAYAERMVREKFFDHTSPGGSTFLMRIRGTGYLSGPIRAWAIGENLAWGTGRLSTPASIVSSWMRSPGHRRNILTPAFRELGLGISIGAPQSGIPATGAATYVNEFGLRRR